jgi:hypothetical protein
MRRAAEVALKRADAVLARDQQNAGVMGYSAGALLALGEGDRAKVRMSRALMFDPDNWDMRYNFACALSVYLQDKDAALEMLVPLYETVTESLLEYSKVDPDLEALHGDPRWQAMVIAAEARLAAAQPTVPVA